MFRNKRLAMPGMKRLLLVVLVAAPLVFPVAGLSTGTASAAPAKQQQGNNKNNQNNKNNKNNQNNKNNNQNNQNNQQQQGGQPGHCSDYNNCDLVALYVNPFIRILSICVGLVVVASLILGGIQYSSSGGDPQKVSAAKTRITNTLLAFVAYAFLYAFLNFLVPGGIFG